jgi:hypothetical protein
MSKLKGHPSLTPAAQLAARHRSLTPAARLAVRGLSQNGDRKGADA